jgi:hypothetical protein
LRNRIPSQEALSNHVCKTDNFCNRFYPDEKGSGDRNIRTGWPARTPSFQQTKSMRSLKNCARSVAISASNSPNPQKSRAETSGAQIAG